MTDPVPADVDGDRSTPADPFPAGLLLVLLMWLGLAVPIFLRMPLTNDAELFDLHVRMLKAGRVLYQDILEPNLPGVIGIHWLVRSVAGTSSEALRAFDLLLLATLLTLVGGWLRRSGMSRRGVLATVLSSCVFYLSGSEWIHCQRDMWMLTVTVVAATFRCHLLERSSRQSAGRTAGCGLLEGLIWGAGIWIKPYVVFAAVGVWLVTARGRGSWRQLVADGAGVLAGGVLAGAAGLGWMAATGCLDAFLEQSREWNPHYFAARSSNWTLSRFVPMAMRFLPWMLLHPVALLVSVGRLRAVMRNPVDAAAAEGAAASLRSTVLAAIYLAWCLHMFLLQHLFDYVHAPGVLLAGFVTADWLARWKRSGAALLASYAFAAVAVFGTPVVNFGSLYLDTARLKDWKPAVFEPPTASLRDRLARFENPNRVDLEKVADFLRSRGAAEGDVVCFNSDLVSLYRRLDVLPPTRFIYVDQNVAYVPSAADLILQTLMQSGHRFVVADVLTSGMSSAGLLSEVSEGEQPVPVHLPEMAGVYPWGQPVVFRAGTYIVHEVTDESVQMQIPGRPWKSAAVRGSASVK